MDTCLGRRDPSPAENGLVFFNSSVTLIVYQDSQEHNASNNVVSRNTLVWQVQQRRQNKSHNLH